MSEPLLTAKEACTWLRCDIRSLYRHIKGGLPAYRLGHRWLFARGEVEAWMKAQAERAAE